MKTPGLQISMSITPPDFDKMQSEFEDAILAEGMEQFVDKVGEVWKEKASTTLKTSKDSYLAGLEIEKTSEGARITLSGWLPLAVEQGIPRFDMKPGLLAGRQSRVIPVGQRRDFGKPVDSFRTVSVSSPKEGWWHPGIQARAIHKQVQAEIENINEEIFNKLISRIKI